MMRPCVARAAGAGIAASTQGAQARLSSPHKADQHGSLAQRDAVYQARFITPAPLCRFIVLLSVSRHKLRLGACIHFAPTPS